MRHTQTHIPDLPDDVVLRVSGVSKKFCRNLKRSMWYGIQDLAGNLLGKTADLRHWTLDSGAGGEASSESLKSIVYSPKTEPDRLKSKVYSPMSDSDGLKSKVHSLKSNSAGLRPSEFWALRNVSFDLKRGECLGLIGRNGCGNTTLLRLIAGIFPPDQGEIAIRGRVGIGEDCRPQTTDFLGGSATGAEDAEVAPSGGSGGLQSAVCSLLPGAQQERDRCPV